MKMHAKWIGSGAVFLLTMALGTSCDLFLAPTDSVPGGRAFPRTNPELIITHSGAETISAVGLSGSAVAHVDANVASAGSGANHAVRVGELTVVTASSENRLTVLDAATLREQRRVDVGTGMNPYHSAALGTNGPAAAANLVATTNWIPGSVVISDAVSGALVQQSSGATARFTVGRAPQALLALPAPVGAPAGQLRLVVANTAFGEPGAPNSFGTATLTELTLTVSTAAGGVRVDLAASRSVSLAFGEHTALALNPTALWHLSDLGTNGTLVVVGSGLNLSGNTDDGVILILDAAALTVQERLAVGGSPGSVTRYDAGGRSYLFMAGPEGVRAVVYDPALPEASRWRGTTVLAAAPAGSNGQALFAGVAVVSGAEPALFVNDYWNNLLRRYRITVDGEGTPQLTAAGTNAVSHGPLHLLLNP